MSRQAQVGVRRKQARRFLMSCMLVLPMCMVSSSGCKKDKGEDPISSLDSPNIVVRNDALHSLGKDKDESSVEAIVQVLRNKQHESTRLLAVNALGAIGSEDGAEVLIDLLKHDTSQEVRIAAAEALGHIKTTLAVDVLVEQLDNDALRPVCIWALGNIGGEESVAHLTTLLDHDDRFVRYNSMRALRQISARED